MDTIRQKIVDAVVDQLKLIRTANSYQYYAITGNYVSNIGERVYKWRSVPATPGSELDYLVVRDIDELVKEPSSEAKRVEKQLHMLVEIVTSGRTADEDLRNKYYADVEIAIGQGAMNRWGVGTGATRPKLNRSLLEQESMVLAGGIVEFYIDYPQYAWYPYAI